MTHRLSHLLLILTLCIGTLSLTGCKEDIVIDPGLFGMHDSYTYRTKGGLQVGFLGNESYFNENYKIPYVPNLIITARGDVADLFIEGFSTNDDSRTMTNVTIADLKLTPGPEGTFLTEMRGFTTPSGSLTIDGKTKAIKQIKIGEIKATTNRIAITELRLIFGEEGADCVRFTDITGVVVREK